MNLFKRPRLQRNRKLLSISRIRNISVLSQNIPGRPQPQLQQQTKLKITDIDPVRRRNIPSPNSSAVARSVTFFERANKKFEFAIRQKSDIQHASVPIIGFMGRTNTGKTTLLKQLLTSKSQPLNQIDKLIAPRNRPGSTDEIRFYTLRSNLKSSLGSSILLADFPGYGHGSSDLQGDVIHQFIQSSLTIRVVYLLVDPYLLVQELDLLVLEMLNEFNIPWQIIVTKCDKLGTADRTLAALDLAESFAVEKTLPISKSTRAMENKKYEVIMTSSKTNFGIPELKYSILSNCKLI
ncbi:P-loop containing nucleoside triphosphate hydrolase protein [Lipomyces oligophaga]|uniref:P-loop containing nucleoside triphosphate hydrolase protein n=1 Tax=Lipomyces oligophaga TaxID=45792 RepID=UPI0034CEF825